MSKRTNDAFDRTRPALLLLFGSTVRQHRPLHPLVTVLGRARGCDISLEAPDISNVHCALVRGADGFYLRDCGSRAGTRVNGDPVTDARLHDGDLLQIGQFCFRFYLPPNLAHTFALARAKQERLERSRRNLARLALSRRGALARVRNLETTLAALQDALDRKAVTLAEQARDYEQRKRKLDQAERDLSCDRKALDLEMSALQARLRDDPPAFAQPDPETPPFTMFPGRPDAPVPDQSLRDEVHYLRKRVDLLCRQLAEKDLLLTGLQKKSLPAGFDWQEAARELAGERIELDRERSELEQQREELRRERERLQAERLSPKTGDTVCDGKPVPQEGSAPVRARDSRTLPPVRNSRVLEKAACPKA